MIAEILNSFELNVEFLKRLVSDLDDHQMIRQPNGVPNHPAWTIGHLVYSCQQIGGEINLSPWLPSEWEAKFGTGSLPVEDATAYPSKVELLIAYDDGQHRLASRLKALERSDMALPLPDVRYRDQFPTVGHAVLHILSSHTALHLGQLTVWRRLMGLSVTPEPFDTPTPER
jgi:hypothetical protein